MAGSAAVPGWFKGQGMWEACMASSDGDIRRRPYHRNCGCALHRSRVVPADAPCSSANSVSYPIRRRSTWHSLSSSSSATNLAASADTSPHVSLDGHSTVGSSVGVTFTIDDDF